MEHPHTHIYILTETSTLTQSTERKNTCTAVPEVPVPVLSLQVRQLTRDQTAQNPLEAQRIKAAGGRIIKNRIYCADEVGMVGMAV